MDTALDPIPLPIHFLADDDNNDDDSRGILGMDQLFLPVYKHAQTSYFDLKSVCSLGSVSL